MEHYTALLLTDAADPEAGGAVAALLAAVGRALGGGVAGAQGPVDGVTRVVVELHDLEHTEH